MKTSQDTETSSDMKTMELPKHYDPKISEPRWQKFWEDNKIFKFIPASTKQPYTIDTPPPTVSGRMHIGHAFSYSQEDFIARFHRMNGKNVFYPFGTDDNGLPTERLVEKTKKVKSTKMDRQEFIDLCVQTIKELKPEFVQDWKNLGMSCDWDTTYSTIDPHSIKTAQKSFLDLWEKNLIERRNEPTMWDITDQTAIAQAELEDVEKESTFNDVQFEAEDGTKIVIATTRPELIPACVMIFVHPDDQRYQKLVGKKIKVPTTERFVEIVADESADPEKGSGILMVCSYGDRFDADAIKRHKKKSHVILNKDGTLNEKSGKYAGLKISEAREKILADLKAEGKLLKQEKIKHTVNVTERSKTPIEFVETPQFFIKILENKNRLIEQGSKINWYPKHMHKRYVQWVEGLEWDWNISRQRHFGVPFPLWYEKDTGKVIIADESQLPVDPLSSLPKNYHKDPANLIPEKDVMDTWMTSSVSPQIAANWVKDNDYNEGVDFAKMIPMSLRPQAHDIIRTWAFYTIVKSYYHHGTLPWKNIAISGHIQDAKGRKMSKSIGNVIDPRLILGKFGTDAFRFFAAGSKLGEDMPYQEKDLVTGQKFITKLWNAAKFALMHLEDYDPETASSIIRSKPFKEKKQSVSAGGRTLRVGNAYPNNEAGASKMLDVNKNNLKTFDSWLLSKLQKLIQECTESFENYEYVRTKMEVEQFFWHKFCDQYLEIVKDRLYNPSIRGEAQRTSAQYALYQSLLAILKLISPITPHITEEIYQLYFKDKENESKNNNRNNSKNNNISSIHISSWPRSDNNLIDEQAELAGDLGVDIISAVRKYKSEQQLSMKDELNELVLVSEENLGEGEKFEDLIESIKADLKAVLKIKKIIYKGKTTLETEQFKIKIVINK